MLTNTLIWPVDLCSFSKDTDIKLWENMSLESLFHILNGCLPGKNCMSSWEHPFMHRNCVTLMAEWTRCLFKTKTTHPCTDFIQSDVAHKATALAYPPFNRQSCSLQHVSSACSVHVFLLVFLSVSLIQMHQSQALSLSLLLVSIVPGSPAFRGCRAFIYFFIFIFFTFNISPDLLWSWHFAARPLLLIVPHHYDVCKLLSRVGFVQTFPSLFR